MPADSSPSPLPERLYFAFGSNLHLAQMAQRCPESRYIGIAHLHNYRFQINERGYANVLPSRDGDDDHVEGMVYLLSLNDEVTLDRYEGVPVAYQKHILPLEVFTAAIYHVGRISSELAIRLDDGGVSALPGDMKAEADKASMMAHSVKGQRAEALVYMSEDFVQDSEPRDEYIDRMNAGISDARKLGMSEVYINTCLRRYIPDRVPLK